MCFHYTVVVRVFSASQLVLSICSESSIWIFSLTPSRTATYQWAEFLFKGRKIYMRNHDFKECNSLSSWSVGLLVYDDLYVCIYDLSNSSAYCECLIILLLVKLEAGDSSAYSAVQPLCFGWSLFWQDKWFQMLSKNLDSCNC